MAIYRSRRQGAPLLVIAGVVAGLLAGVALGRWTSPDLSADIAALRTETGAIRSSLEVLRLEYHKLLDNEGDPGGAESALARAASTFAELRPSLAAVDRMSTDSLAEALADVQAQVDARAAEPAVAAAIDVAEAALAAVFGEASGGT